MKTGSFCITVGYGSSDHFTAVNKTGSRRFLTQSLGQFRLFACGGHMQINKVKFSGTAADRTFRSLGRNGRAGPTAELYLNPEQLCVINLLVNAKGPITHTYPERILNTGGSIRAGFSFSEPHSIGQMARADQEGVGSRSVAVTRCSHEMRIVSYTRPLQSAATPSALSRNSK